MWKMIWVDDSVELHDNQEVLALVTRRDKDIMNWRIAHKELVIVAKDEERLLGNKK